MDTTHKNEGVGDGRAKMKLMLAEQFALSPNMPIIVPLVLNLAAVTYI